MYVCMYVCMHCLIFKHTPLTTSVNIELISSLVQKGRSSLVLYVSPVVIGPEFKFISPASVRLNLKFDLYRFK